MTLDYDDSVSDEAKRPWLDQASLPVAIAHAGCRYEVLEPDFNYPIDAHFLPSPSVRLYHYHGMERLEAAAHTAEIEDLLVSSGLLRSLAHYMEPLRRQREEAAVFGDQIAALATRKPAVKEQLRAGKDDPDFDVTEAKRQLTQWRVEDAGLRPKWAAVVEPLFYDEEWLMPAPRMVHHG